jgi:hypothetical protein
VWSRALGDRIRIRSVLPRGGGADRRAASGARRPRFGSRTAEDRLAPGPRASGSAVDIDDPADPAGGFTGHCRTEETAQELLSAVRGRSAQRVLAIRLHPLATHRWHGVEIINWLDDHPRYLLAAVARRRITGEDLVTTFLPPSTARGCPGPRSQIGCSDGTHVHVGSCKPSWTASVASTPPPAARNSDALSIGEYLTSGWIESREPGEL